MYGNNLDEFYEVFDLTDILNLSFLLITQQELSPNTDRFAMLSLISPVVIRKTLEMHMETGHSTCQSKPTHQKDLCCPFCLYQTKNKNNMIDHIVLHRGMLEHLQDL